MSGHDLAEVLEIMVFFGFILALVCLRLVYDLLSGKDQPKLVGWRQRWRDRWRQRVQGLRGRGFGRNVGLADQEPAGQGLSGDEREMEERMMRLLDRMEQRITNLETILMDRERVGAAGDRR